MEKYIQINILQSLCTYWWQSIMHVRGNRKIRAPTGHIWNRRILFIKKWYSNRRPMGLLRNKSGGRGKSGINFVSNDYLSYATKYAKLYAHNDIVYYDVSYYYTCQWK